MSSMSSRPLDTYDNISIAQIPIYAIFLFGSSYLLFKHGWQRGSGWRFLIVLSLARLIGSAMRLATLSDPYNKDLYIGWQVLNSIGLGPLVLTVLGLCGWLFDSINAQGQAKLTVKPIFQLGIQLLMIVGIILLIVGGTQADYSLSATSTNATSWPTTSEAGLGIMIAVLGLLVAQVLLLFVNYNHILGGERRILIAIVVSVPLLVVRVIYSCLIIYGNVSSTVWLYFAMEVLMEILVSFICEAVGVTLQKPAPISKHDVERHHGSDKHAHGQH